MDLLKNSGHHPPTLSKFLLKVGGSTELRRMESRIFSKYKLLATFHPFASTIKQTFSFQKFATNKRKNDPAAKMPWFLTNLEARFVISVFVVVFVKPTLKLE